MAAGQYSTERHAVASNIAQYDDYRSLPLVSTGCDSYASWDPRFKHLSPMLTVPAIVDRMQELLPKGKFSRDKHLIITGGEPLLGWQKTYPGLLDEIYMRDMDLTHITFETNGSQPIDNMLLLYLCEKADTHGLEVTFSISAKLPCSGEVWAAAICPTIVKTYLEIPRNRSYFKFVVATAQDVTDAQTAIAQYKSAGIDIPVYLMPVGGVNSVYELNERQVADYCRDNGLRFSPRIQVPLYKNAWGT